MALKIIGAGLGRTGTASLKVALEQLGFNKCYHMGEVLSNNSSVPLWIEASKGNPQWDKIFDGYSAAVDYPSCSFWREQMEYYPEAKVVLSIRNPESWFDSVNSTIMSPDVNDWLRGSPFKEFFELCVWKDFEKHILDKDFMVDYFRGRIEAIKAEVSPDRLLVFDVKEGWGSLCKFLNVDIPDTEFPRVNSREETRRILDAMVSIQDDSNIQDSLAAQSDRLFKNRR
jgi:hypothetical protein